jgi:hypothetical protein
MVGNVPVRLGMTPASVMNALGEQYKMVDRGKTNGASVWAVTTRGEVRRFLAMLHSGKIGVSR